MRFHQEVIPVKCINIFINLKKNIVWNNDEKNIIK